MAVSISWTGEGLAFRGTADGGAEVIFDSDGKIGPSPTNSLLGSMAACMGIDVVMILQKSRVNIEDLVVEVSGTRAEQPPRKFESMVLTYRIAGPGPEDDEKIQRAVDLSRDKYCSVLHTLRPDLDLEIRIERA